MPVWGEKGEVKTTVLPSNPENKFYIASDGLYDQIGGKDARPFGYRTFQEIILKNHEKSQSDISGLVWKAFETYRGDQARRDDVQMISFRI